MEMTLHLCCICGIPLWKQSWRERISGVAISRLDSFRCLASPVFFPPSFCFLVFSLLSEWRKETLDIPSAWIKQLTFGCQALGITVHSHQEGRERQSVRKAFISYVSQRRSAVSRNIAIFGQCGCQNKVEVWEKLQTVKHSGNVYVKNLQLQ